MVGRCKMEREAPRSAWEEWEVFEGCYEKAGRWLFRSSDGGVQCLGDARLWRKVEILGRAMSVVWI